MSRQDYILLASVIFEAKAEGLSIDETAERLAEKLLKDNPRFDTARFLQACGQ